MSSNHALLAHMTMAVQQAGDLIMSYFRPGEHPGPEAMMPAKGKNNPLTKADLEANQCLHQMLTSILPDCGWLSEESVDDPERLNRERVWVVDPMDGTKDFLAGRPEFAVSVALVEKGIPLAASVYNPARNELFTALAGQGAWKNGQPIRTSNRTVWQGATCLTSRSEFARGVWSSFQQELALRSIGSIAYKLALIAVGEADLTFTLTPKSEWDFCGGLLLVQEAGGLVTDQTGAPFCFNQRDTEVPAVLTSNGPLHPALLHRLRHCPPTMGERDSSRIFSPMTHPARE